MEASTTSSSMGVLLSFTVITALGCFIFSNLFFMAFQNMTSLSTFMPPEVEPAQAHCKVKNIMINLEKDGHMEESAVANPVDVPIEIT